MKSLLVKLIFTGLMCPALAWNLSGPEKARPLASKIDTQRIQAALDSGDNRAAKTLLEEAVRIHQTTGLLDSIFIARNLAVLYALDSRTKDKGRYYMFRLLSWIPGDRLQDMDVTEDIRHELDRIRNEFFMTNENKEPTITKPEKESKWATMDSVGLPPNHKAVNQNPISGNTPITPKRFTGKKYWVLGSGGLIGLGMVIGSIIWINSDEKIVVNRKALIIGNGNGGT